MPVSDWLDLMPATVTHRPVTGRDAYGKPTLGTTASYRARVVYKLRRTVSRVTGEDTLSSAQVWIAGIIPGLKIDDEIVLPDGVKPVLLNWEQFTDERGNHHMKLIFR